jgi:hypothetical protein
MPASATTYCLEHVLAARVFPLRGRLTIRALRGEIWVSGENIGDSVLGAGQAIELHGVGRIGVQALRDCARFELDADTRPASVSALVHLSAR